MLTKILVPIAFSKYSKGIVRFAHELAKPLGAVMLIANVVNERDLEAVEKIASYGYKVDSDRYIATIQKERVEMIEKLIGELNIGEGEYDYTMLAGDPAEELLKVVVKEKVDLVVMGTKGRDLRHIFAGSVAERMFRKCPVPVVSYRDKEIRDQLEHRIRRDFEL